VDFGDTLTVPTGSAIKLTFSLAALAGIRSAALIGNGVRAAHRDFDPAPRHARAEFVLRADRPGWYALVVEDAQGRKAYTDPIWVDVVRAH
jgi:hypothetical protein